MYVAKYMYHARKTPRNKFTDPSLKHLQPNQNYKVIPLRVRWYTQNKRYEENGTRVAGCSPFTEAYTNKMIPLKCHRSNFLISYLSSINLSYLSF